MKPVLFAIAAIVFYAAENVFIERKLANVSPAALMVLLSLQVVLLGIPFLLLQRHAGDGFAMPQAGQWRFVLVCGALLACADFCYFSAYKNGGEIMKITTIAILLPVAASVVKFLMGGGMPSLTQLAGWAFAAVGVVLVSKS